MSRAFKYQGYQIDKDSCDKITLIFLRKDKIRQFVQLLFYLLSLGILYEIARWVIWFELQQYSRTSQENATHVLVRTQTNAMQIVKIKSIRLPISVLGIASQNIAEFKYFTFRHLKYYIEPTQGIFTPVEFQLPRTFDEIHCMFEDGVDEVDLQARLKFFGQCLIDVPVPSIASLLAKEASHPFFVFQVLSIILWIVEQYYYYAITIFVLALGSLLSTVIEIRKNMKDIRRMALHECEVEVKRSSGWQKVRSRYVVPGDLVKVPEKTQLPCDLILLKGSCLMDEGMLTGESQPILKENLPKHSGPYVDDKKYLLISGTKALTCRGDCIALVVSTGFHTKKGELVRAILFPKPNRFKFYSDSIKFIGFLTLVALFGFLISLHSLISQKVGNLGLFFCSADLITIAVPPALPLAMSAGTAFAISRLKSKGISCISPPAVNSSGRVSIICFDKTGTLTEDSMKLKGVWDSKTLTVQENLNSCSETLQESLAACQSLIKLNNILTGDPQEVAIFEHLDWDFIESDDCRCKLVKESTEIKIVYMYQFSSSTKRMGVISLKSEQLSLHMKGAPEVILPLCHNVPSSVYANLLSFSQAGNRVLACAYKNLDNFHPSTQLEDIEKGLNFLGLILLHNPLKAETTNTLSVLLDADVRCVISTGDALLTALAVGKACGIIDPDEEIVLGSNNEDEVVWENDQGLRTELSANKPQGIVATGNLLELLKKQNSPILQYVLDNGRVFGRMSPNQKVLLVELLQRDEVQVAMVGDGANDCGALKAADVGLSILKSNSEDSSGEASIAAPFSADNLPAIIELLKEGRAALVTSFQCFKFITMYSMIQFVCINFLYFLKSNMMDLQFLYEDLFMILPLAVFMAYTGASSQLTRTLPPGALISIPVISSVIGQVAIQGSFQIFSYFILVEQDWHEDQETINGTDPKSFTINAFSPYPAYENTVLFLISSVQLLIVCISFSIGPPYRQPAYRNLYFTISCIGITAISFYLTVFPSKNTRELLQMMDMPMSFKWTLFGIILFGCLVTWLYERFGVGLITRLIKKYIR